MNFLKMISIMNIKEKTKLLNTISFVFGIFLIAFLVQLASVLKGDNLVFPDIIKIIKTFFLLLSKKETYLLIATTFFHLLVTLVISFLFGLLTGLFQGFSNFFHKLTSPLMSLLRSMPMIVLTVIIMVLSDYQNVPYIVTSLVLIPIISEAVCHGIKNIDRDLIDAYLLFTNFNLKVFFTVYIPLIKGYLHQAFVNSVGMGIKVIVTAEYLVQCRNSLGKAVFESTYFNEYEEIYAYALIMVLIVLLVTKLPDFQLKKIKK